MTTTQITPVTLARKPVRGGWVLYDGECSLCTTSAARFASLLHRYYFAVAPLQTPWMQERLQLEPGKPLLEMKLLTTGGEVFGGAEALWQIARRIWWAWPLFAVSFLPGARFLLDAVYRQVAARRNCFGGQCVIKRPPQQLIRDWIPLFVLPVVAWLLTRSFAGWVMMWALVMALVFGFKWAIWKRAERRFGRGNILCFAGFFSWPGMEAEVFFKPRTKPCGIPGIKWLAAVAKMIFGAALVWLVARQLVANEPLLAGWVGMIGVVFMLHFGFFDLLGLAWRRAGFAVEPIMRAPVLSQSPGEFWGQRWNLAFSRIAHDYFLLPTRRKLGIGGAIFATFAVSGLIHDLVISVPARGGYGLPTMYFLIQGLSVIFARTAFAGKTGSARSWLFTAVVTAGPAFWLFPPPFIRNIILPMLHAIGAT